MSVSLSRLSIFGLLLHLVFFYSIFDIYFSSPLVQNLEPMPSEGILRFELVHFMFMFHAFEIIRYIIVDVISRLASSSSFGPSPRPFRGRRSSRGQVFRVEQARGIASAVSPRRHPARRRLGNLAHARAHRIPTRTRRPHCR